MKNQRGKSKILVILLLTIVAFAGFEIVKSIGRQLGLWGYGDTVAAAPPRMPNQPKRNPWVHPLGKIYSGVKVYLTSAHEPYGSIVGGDSDYVLVAKNNGKYIWFPRKLFISSNASYYVRSDDPAIKAGRWKVVHVGEWPAEGP